MLRLYKELVQEISLPPGKYCIIPIAYENSTTVGTEGKFLMRVFTEKHCAFTPDGRQIFLHKIIDSISDYDFNQFWGFKPNENR